MFRSRDHDHVWAYQHLWQAVVTLCHSLPKKLISMTTCQLVSIFGKLRKHLESFACSGARVRGGALGAGPPPLRHSKPAILPEPVQDPLQLARQRGCFDSGPANKSEWLRIIRELLWLSYGQTP